VRAQDVDVPLAPLPSGRHGLPREEVIRSQRIRLLRAAVEVAGHDGYAAMTVSAVIARASVSRKTFVAAHVRRGATAQLPAMLPDLLYCALAPFLGPVAAAEAAAAELHPLAVGNRER